LDENGDFMKFGDIYKMERYGLCECGRSMRILEQIGDSRTEFRCECERTYSTVDPKKEEEAKRKRIA
jgi:hypothetical protein